MATIQLKEKDKTADDKQNPTMRIRLWLEADDGVIFGMGRLMLLREVARQGSIKAAAEKLGMSYRGAWGKIKKTEELLGAALISKNSCRRSGSNLTPFAMEIITRFDQWFREVEDFALLSSRRHLPFMPKKFSSAPKSAKNNTLK